MKLLTIAGPPSVGKTSVIRHIVKTFRAAQPSFLKIDVVKAFEDEELAQEFGIPTRKVYSGDLCPDHAGVMVMEDALDWAEENESGMLIVESAGLCLRCTPYVTQGLGIIVIAATGGSNSPLKMSPMIALADIAVVTKVDLISQAEKEVFRECVKAVTNDIEIVETNAIHGTGLRYLYKLILANPPLERTKEIILRGNPPLGVCTICIGKKEIGWKNHFGVVRQLNNADMIYRGE